MLATLIEYETPKVVTVHNVSIGYLSSRTSKMTKTALLERFRFFKN